MRIPFRRAPDYLVEPMQRTAAAALPALHREDFVRPWSADEFTALIDQDTVFGHLGFQIGRPEPVGFLLARQAAGEGEILTVTVARAHRGRGLGRLLMDGALMEFHARRAETVFLEVAETNGPALALYRRLDFHEVGKRRGYYDAADGGEKTTALVMRRDLAPVRRR